MMSNSKTITNLESSLYPSNADRRSVGMMGSDIAPSVLAVCRIEGAQSDLHYYNTTFSGGAGVSHQCLYNQVWWVVGLCDRQPGVSCCGITIPPVLPYIRLPLCYFFPSPNPQPSFSPCSQVSPDSRLKSRFVSPRPFAPRTSSQFTDQLQTPPQTPEDGPTSDDYMAPTALEVLATLFPNSEVARAALPYARALRITSRQGVTPEASTWDGVVLSLPGQERTLYVIGRGAEALMLRESITALLDLADEYLECTAFVIALEKNTPGLGELVHALTYLSGQIVTKPPFVANPTYVLVGIEL
ncbi:hypothetical protein RSAG8_01718, partial [Rhizoctonia solani AG-8 WAC10335]